MILQILQTTVLQIPSIVVTLAGAIVFGGWVAFILSFISVMIGSLIMFWLGRAFGRKFLFYLFGETACNKWIKRLEEGKYIFVLMMLFPLFPDDILCAVAGVTDMKFSFFFITCVVARAVGIGCTTFFGGGEIIPFSASSVAIWLVIAIVMFALFYLSIKYQNKIDAVINQMLKKNK